MSGLVDGRDQGTGRDTESAKRLEERPCGPKSWSDSRKQRTVPIAQADRESVRSELWNWLDKHPGDAAAHDSERLRLVSATRASHQQPVANPRLRKAIGASNGPLGTTRACYRRQPLRISIAPIISLIIIAREAYNLSRYKTARVASSRHDKAQESRDTHRKAPGLRSQAVRNI